MSVYKHLTPLPGTVISYLDIGSGYKIYSNTLQKNLGTISRYWPWNNNNH